MVRIAFQSLRVLDVCALAVKMLAVPANFMGFSTANQADSVRDGQVAADHYSYPGTRTFRSALLPARNILFPAFSNTLQNS